MNGTIGVTSQLGVGSTFWFRLRLPVNSRTASRAQSLHGVRALVVDTDEYARSVATRYLTAWGVTVVEAPNLLEAIHLLERRRDEKPFDLAMLDGNLPNDDIADLVRTARGIDALHSTPLILASTSDQPGRGAKAISAGFTAYLIKPLRQSPLFDCLATIVDAARSGEPTRAEALVKLDVPGMQTGSSEERILVVEDNFVNQRLATKQLQRLGFAAVIAENGRVAVETLRREHFALVLMDLQMPDMDGFTATRHIRKDEQLTGRRVPIVAVTADARPEDRTACMAAEMDDYISKPLSLDDLRQVLARWMPAKALTPQAPL
jgi:CheY-like chemotaxis protein